MLRRKAGNRAYWGLTRAGSAPGVSGGLEQLAIRVAALRMGPGTKKARSDTRSDRAMGWTTGLEPATSGSTSQRSAN
jgi:hypothetical protein